MNTSCHICGRKLDNQSDPLSADCGGDCWGCIGEMEADSGYEPSLEIVREEFKLGYRPNWLPPPIIFCSEFLSVKDGIKVTIEIKIVRPLGEPWGNENIEVAFLSSDHVKNSSVILESAKFKTTDSGAVKIYYVYPRLIGDNEAWVEISRGTNKWAFPVREN